MWEMKKVPEVLYTLMIVANALRKILDKRMN